MRKPLMDAVEEMGHLGIVLEGLDKVAKYKCLDAMDILDYLETCKAISNSRPARRAGQWRPGKREVEIHGKLLIEGREKELASTFLHEIAHAITEFVYPLTTKHHGIEWKFVMRCLKQPEERTHNYDFLNGEDTANYIYGCVCGCGMETNMQRKKKHPPKFSFFKKCKGQLYLKRDNKLGRTYPNPGKQEITKEEKIAYVMNRTHRTRRFRF